jgi:pyroglutamyl-peptidase
MRVLLAGFGPFPGAPLNPSAAVAQALARRRRPALSGLDRSVHTFATTYAAVDHDLPKLFANKPDIILIFGLAGRRRQICIETRARNACSVLFPDASGLRPAKGVIEAAGPQARFGRAPFHRLRSASRASNVPVRLSRDAGRYLCNYVYWRALERAPDGAPLVQFVHIPALARQARPLHRGNKKRHAPSFSQVVAAAENLLVALAAARKH